MADNNEQTEGRLLARPKKVNGTAPVGLQPLVLGAARDSYLYVLATYRAKRPAPCSRSTNGAGGHARQGLNLLRSLADEAGVLLLAPASREHTWDLLVGRRYGPDVTIMDRALEQVFSRYAVDTARIAVGGFSDGASYALSLGITNGDLFTHVLAFSPGFVAPAARVGMPRIFVSHGTRDEVLPIDFCSRKIVPMLKRAGYDVRYREFDGGHTISPQIALAAVGWFTGQRR
jgi:phospholipase/carboxylesterase